jgi:hypothetical protein
MAAFIVPPPSKLHRNGAYFARPDFRLAIKSSAISPTAGVGEVTSPEDWQGITFIRHNRPTAKADRRRPIGDEAREGPHTATFPLGDEKTSAADKTLP